jgi:hypothetical protein
MILKLNFRNYFQFNNKIILLKTQRMIKTAVFQQHSGYFFLLFFSIAEYLRWKLYAFDGVSSVLIGCTNDLKA